MVEKRFEIKDSSLVEGAKVIVDNKRKYTFPITKDESTLVVYEKILVRQDMMIDSQEKQLQKQHGVIEEQDKRIKELQQIIDKDLCGMTEKQFHLKIKWKNREKTEAYEIVLYDGGQPLCEFISVDDARLVRDILNEQEERIKNLKETIIAGR